MFAGAQASVAFDHYFGTLTFGPQKPRATEEGGLMVHLVVGGVAF
jgi:phospholipase C